MKEVFILANYNYVKFMRGPKTAFDALQIKNNDTLYFIHDADVNKTDLYLGDVLISDSSSVLSPEAKEYLDKITAALNTKESDPNKQLQDGQFLVYDAEENSWVPASLDAFTGASAEAAGKAGLVPAPEIGAQGKYLRGDGSWADLTSDVLPQVIASIVGDSEDDKISEDFDTLKEISDWILNHPAGVAEINNRLIALEAALGVIKQEIKYTDKEGNSVDSKDKVQVTDGTGSEVVDENGDPLYHYEPKVDENGDPIPKTDENGDPIVAQVVVIDEDGDPVIDKDGNVVTRDAVNFVQETDEEGNPLYYQEDGTIGTEVTDDPVYKTTTEETGYPVLDDDGNQVTDEESNPLYYVTEQVIIYEPAVEEIKQDTNIDGLKKVIAGSVSNYDALQTSIIQNPVGNLNSRLTGLENQFNKITETKTIEQNGASISKIIIRSVGDLDTLNDTIVDEDGNNPDNIVEALNILDDRTIWHTLT